MSIVHCALSRLWLQLLPLMPSFVIHSAFLLSFAAHNFERDSKMYRSEKCVTLPCFDGSVYTFAVFIIFRQKFIFGRNKKSTKCLYKNKTSECKRNVNFYLTENRLLIAMNIPIGVIERRDGRYLSKKNSDRKLNFQFHVDCISQRLCTLSIFRDLFWRRKTEYFCD